MDQAYRNQSEKLVESLAAGGIEDSRVLDAFAAVSRHLFVPEALKGNAYSNTSLPIGEGQMISQPLTVARMLQLLRLEGGERVLEVGTGSGFQAALLARLCEQVFTVERIENLGRRARRVLDSLGIYNVNVRIGDGTMGWSRYQPYDAIVVAAAGPAPPPVLLAQLAPGGRLVMPEGDSNVATMVLVEKSGDGYRKISGEDCRFVPLIGKEAWSDESSAANGG
ncbi:MAG: protein-L-isoaspartate(D-aspartate) O-methyltransferase [Candidatus Glassbacteria bacterium]|nr:protein-L-isoaspartate(D-aspartate) O-methyltransferase [Candidatus Glassbacteria bacterium]